MAEEKLVEVVLGQPHYVDGEVKPAGATVKVPEHMAEAMAYVPPVVATPAVVESPSAVTTPENVPIVKPTGK